MAAYIYTLEYPEGNVRYVGQSKNPKKRYFDHLRKTREGSKKIEWIQSLLSENKKPILNIIEEVDDQNYDFEVFYISLFKSWGFDLVNMTSGGERNKHLDKNLIDRFKDIAQEKLKINPHGPRYQIRASEETKEKMRQIALNRTDKRLDTSKPIYQFDLEGNFIQEFPSSRVALRFLGKKDTTTLLKCLNGEFHKAHNFIWVRKEDLNRDPDLVKRKVELLNTKYIRRRQNAKKYYNNSNS